MTYRRQENQTVPGFEKNERALGDQVHKLTVFQFS